MNFIKNLPTLIMPVCLVILAVVLSKNKSGKIMDVFFDGCREGLDNCVSLVPSMLVVFSGVSLLFSSGALDILSNIFSPLFELLNVPVELLALIVLRPFSGSSVTAVVDKMFGTFGSDSVVSKIASCFVGCTDTILYTLAVYFSAAGIKKVRYAFLASILVMFFSIFVSVWLIELFFT